MWLRQNLALTVVPEGNVATAELSNDYWWLAAWVEANQTFQVMLP